MNAASRRHTIAAMLEAPWALPACLALTALLRAAALLVRPLEQTSDFAWYFERAASLAAGHGYNENGILTAFWPVGWPGALAALLTLTGPSPLAGQLANIVMAVLIGFLVARLGATLFGSRAAGTLACLLLAIFPNQIGYVPLLSAEIFYELLLLIAVTLLLRERPAPVFLAGLVLGLATLTKAQSLLLPAVLLAWVALLSTPLNHDWSRHGVRLRRLVGLACTAYIGLAMVVLPWTYRNWTVFHTVIPVSTNGGWTLLTGNNPQANGDYITDTPLAEGITHDPAQQVEMDAIARARAIQWIRQNPGRFLTLMPVKAFRLWAPDGESEWFYQRGYARYAAQSHLFRAVRVLNQAYYVLLLLLAAPSLLMLLGRRTTVPPWAHAGLGLFAFFTAISLVFSGQSRFHVALMPFMALYAAWTITRWTARAAPAQVPVSVPE